MDDVMSSIYNIIENTNDDEEHQDKMQMEYASLSEDIVELNDKAVAAMLRNDFGGALGMLQNALARISALQSRPNNNNSMARDMIRPLCSSFDDECPISSVPIVTKDVCSAPFDGIFEFFNHALIIPHRCDWLLNCPKNKSRALAILLHNTALLYHIQAQRTGDSSLFRAALQYYGWSYYTIESTSKELGFHDALLVLCSLFNNMGHIHAALMNTDMTRQCLKWLQSTFANSKIKRALYPGDYKFFFQYVSMPFNNQLLIAPVA